MMIVVGILAKSVAVWLIVLAMSENQVAVGSRFKRTTCLKYPSLPFSLSPAIAGFSGTNSSRVNGTAPFNIIGVQFAREGQFPAYARLSVTDYEKLEASYTCGATLIGERFLLTAASCVRNAIESCYIADSIKHGDIALIKLERPIEFSNLVRQAWLPHKPLGHDEPAQLVGFDALDQSSESSSPGLQVVPVMRTHCDRFSSSKNFMCLRPVQPVDQQSIICNGESGGGVFVQARDGRQFVHGIASHIRGNYQCAIGSANDGYYTDVHKLSKWIHLTMLKMSHRHHHE